MTIHVECLTCRSALRVRDEFAGKKCRCPRCMSPFQVPAAGQPTPAAEEPETYSLANVSESVRGFLPLRSAARDATPSKGAAIAAKPSRPTRSAHEILTAFREEIAPVRPTPLYRFWILIVAAVMILLPLIYLGIIALACVGLVYHVTQDLEVFQNLNDVRVAVLIYVGPLFAGVILVGFLVKPLFARPRRKSKARVLDPAREPLLFAFVDGVCAAVRSATPRRIEVDCQVNASAHLEGGPLGLFGQDLVLTIGLPLAAGLSLKEFAGVLAHEFGHFSQRAGMRLYARIGSVNAWFARVVSERDDWDETLQAWSRQGGYFWLVVVLARMTVWLTRRVLWVLMMAGHLVSGFLSRQMEYDADRYQTRLVGGAVFATTMKRIVELSMAFQGACSDLSESWRERRLPDDLPRLVLANVAQIPAAVRKAYHEALAKRRVSVFDTHPADQDRVVRALAEAAKGSFELDGPATDLFRDFDQLAKAATFAHYRAILGREVTKEQLYPVVEAVREYEDRVEGSKAVARFFLESYSHLRPLPLPLQTPQQPAKLKEARLNLKQARTAMAEAREEYQVALREYSNLLDRAAQIDAATWLLKTNFKIKAADFQLPLATLAAAENLARSTAANLRRVEAALASFEAAAVCRLSTALALLEAEAVAARISDAGAWRNEVCVLYPLAAQFGNCLVSALLPVFQARDALGQTFRYWKGNEQNQRLLNAILRGAARLHEALQELSGKFGSVRYPFPHAQEEITLARFALPHVPDKGAVADLLRASEALNQTLMPLWGRVLGRLVLAAEEVEHALGMRPLAQSGSAAMPEDAREV